MNAAAKLFIALVIVVSGFFVASLFGPAELASSANSWSATSGKGSGSTKTGEDPALLFGHVQLIPDTPLPQAEKPPSAVLKGTIVPSPSASQDAKAYMPLTMPEPAPLWLSARAKGTLDPPVEVVPQDKQLTAIRTEWPADESRTVSPAYFANENWTDNSLPGERISPDRLTSAAQLEFDEAENQDRTHIVIDGDSLARLAERYLDDANRWNEIYVMNRDQLTTPDLLPIGIELKLPPKSPDANYQAAIADGMVKVDPATISASDPPEARLLRPQTAKPIYQQYHFTVAD